MSRISLARIDDGQRELPGIFSAVGGTPLRRLRRVAAHLRHVALYAKAEHLNPSGSVKDRAARAILLDGLRRGTLFPGQTVLEATSGNTGIALAILARARFKFQRLGSKTPGGEQRNQDQPDRFHTANLMPGRSGLQARRR